MGANSKLLRAQNDTNDPKWPKSLLRWSDDNTMLVLVLILCWYKLNCWTNVVNLYAGYKPVNWTPRWSNRCDDLESYTRQQNLRIVGIPESTEGSENADTCLQKVKEEIAKLDTNRPSPSNGSQERPKWEPSPTCDDRPVHVLEVQNACVPEEEERKRQQQCSLLRRPDKFTSTWQKDELIWRRKR